MPKTNEKDAYFFSHDCNARNDPKILALRSVYGAEGYGVYFMLVEILREQPEYRLSVNKYIWNTLAMQMQVEASHLEQIITDCCTEFAENGNTHGLAEPVGEGDSAADHLVGVLRVDTETHGYVNGFVKFGKARRHGFRDGVFH